MPCLHGVDVLTAEQFVEVEQIAALQPLCDAAQFLGSYLVEGVPLDRAVFWQIGPTRQNWNPVVSFDQLVVGDIELDSSWLRA